MDHLLLFYQKQKVTFSEKEDQLRKKIAWISLFRFLSFIAVPASLIYLLRLGTTAGVIPATAFLAVFLILVKKHIWLNKEKKRFGILSVLAENEIKALNHQFTHFEEGDEFRSPGHNFSWDLDLFGEGSLFQFLNRTSTISGKRKLADWLENPPLLKEEIKQRQEAIKELSEKRKWRMEFLAAGKMFQETAGQHKEVLDWTAEKLPLRNARLIKMLILLIPILTILMIFPATLYGINFPLWIMIFAQWALLYGFRKKVKHYFAFFSRKSGLVEKYISLLKEIEKEPFHSKGMVLFKNKLSDPESASQTISRLGKLVRQFEYRQNILVGFILNSVFLWDIRCVYRLREWHLENNRKLVEWLETLESIDALISLGNFADNHPAFAYPEILGDNFIFDAAELGHPLLHPDKRVNSDVQIEGSPRTVIVTGANMAGKSTFLRAVGVNLVLSRMGAPVCATHCRLKPVALYTNMRTTDSLFKDESYFYAELKRLSYILKELENGKELFIILDEMLKGTNSIDKLNGSRELIRKLAGYKAVSLIATHDLKLSELENEMPGIVVNKCFEIKIVDNELVFDYKLSDGVTQTMNATFLMKKMGIIDSDTE